MRTPAAAHFSTTSRCQSTANHAMTESAMIPPTPSVSASSSRDAARMASIDPNFWARARAAVGPTWRMDRLTSTRHSSRDFAAPMKSSSFLPLALRVPRATPSSPTFFFAAVVYTSVRSRSAAVSANKSPSSDSTPRWMRSAAPRSPRCSMSKPPREARNSTRRRSCPGQ